MSKGVSFDKVWERRVEKQPFSKEDYLQRKEVGEYDEPVDDAYAREIQTNTYFNKLVSNMPDIANRIQYTGPIMPKKEAVPQTNPSLKGILKTSPNYVRRTEVPKPKEASIFGAFRGWYNAKTEAPKAKRPFAPAYMFHAGHIFPA